MTISAAALAKLDTSQNLTSFLSIKLPTRLIRPVSPHIKVFSDIVDIFFYPFLSSCRATDVATGRACHDPKKSPDKGKLHTWVPPPDQRIGRPHNFSNLTSLELSAAAFGGIEYYKNCHLLSIVDNLEFQNATILLHQEDKEDTNRLVSKLLKNLMSKILQ